MNNPDLVRAVVIPVLEAIVTGLLIAIVTACICALKGWPLYWSLASGTVSMLLSWLIFHSHWMRIVQGILLPDQVNILDPDTIRSIGRYRGEPEPYEPAQPVRIELVHQNPGGYLEGQYIDLPCEMDQLQALATGLANGAPLTTHTWSGSHATFTRAQWEHIRYELIRRGLVRAVNPRAPNMGYELTVVGIHVFKKLAAPAPHDKDR